jgi:hypothetical protein
MYQCEQKLTITGTPIQPGQINISRSEIENDFLINITKDLVVGRCGFSSTAAHSCFRIQQRAIKI